MKWQRIGVQRLAALLLGALAFGLVLAATEPPAPGLDPDALSYLGAAQSLVEGRTYKIPTSSWQSADSTAPLAHFPPGYSTILAAPIALGSDPIQSARIIQATAAFVTVALLVVLVASATNLVTASVLAIALMAMTSMHEVHVSVLSEPLYLMWTMLTLAAMVWWPNRPLRAGLVAGAAIMTRYAGASIVGAVSLWMLLQPGSWRQRITRAGIAAAPGVILQLLWMLRTRSAHGAEQIRRFAVYGTLGPTIRQGVETITTWLAPDPTLLRNVPNRGIIALAMALVLGAVVMMGYQWLRWTRTNRPDDHAAFPLLHACALLLASYLGLLIVSRLFADPMIPFDERIMAPALVLMMVIIATTMSTWWRRSRLRVARVAVGLMIAAWWLASAAATRLEARYALGWGSDLAGQQWRTSELLAWARANASNLPLYTNWPAAVYFYLHRTSHGLPARADARTLQAFGDTIRARNGRILLFGPYNPEYIPNDSLFNVPGVTMITELRDGAVLAPSHEPVEP